MSDQQRDVDRNLLFGILALQLDFVSQDVLIRAMHAWVLHKTRPLGQILREQRVLEEEDLAVLETLVCRHLSKHANDASRSLATVSVAEPLRHELEQLSDPQLRAAVSTISWSQTPAFALNTGSHHPAGGSPFPSAATGTLTSTGVRFQILRPHAKGGLGEVFVARDEELRREVALKEIQAKYADHPDCRARFLREAEITGGLEHPGVVPVYGLGQYADGRPYYAMRFIGGDSFKVAIDRFHQAAASRQDASERALEQRQLLGRFVATCNAVAYAHSRGVIHRDLKPANVMLGNFGETLVVDWGLAKRIDQSEKAVDPGEIPLVTDGEGARLTHQGRAMGTPGFMSPEQAAGRHDSVSFASDVYSLGATLYYLLTGQPAFVNVSMKEYLAQVQCGAFPPPRQKNPRVPAALEAICLKAMALQPADRYGSAKALADDIEYWLADKPIAAFQEPLRARLERWARHHRPVVSGAAALLLTAVIGLTLGLVAVRAEQVQTARQRDLAETNLDLARKAVDDCYLLAAEHPLLQDQHQREARKLLLEKALPYYQNFRGQREDDEGIQDQLANNLYRVAYITEEIGRENEALAAFGQAAAMWEKLAAEHPQVARYQSDLAKTFNSLALLQKKIGQGEQAAGSYERARTLREKLVADYPEVGAYQNDLAGTLTNQGNYQRETGQRDLAVQSLAKACGLQEKLLAEHPNVEKYQTDLAKTYTNLGLVQSDSSKLAAAAAAYDKARIIEEKLVTEHPHDGEYRHSLARTFLNLANLQRLTRQNAAAITSYERARAGMEKLVAEYPSLVEYQRALASICNNLGGLQQVTGKPEAAATSYEQARNLLEKLVAEHPRIGGYQQALANTFISLGILKTEHGKPEDARKYLDKAITIQEKLVAEHSEVTDYPLNLSGTYVNLGLLLEKTGNAPESLGCYAKAIAQLKALHQRLPRHPTVQQFLRNAYWARAQALDRSGQHSTAIDDWEQALALDSSPEGSYLRLRRAMSLARAGQHARAVAEAELLAQEKNPKGNTLYDLACLWAVASTAVGRDLQLSTTDRASLAEHYADKALELLTRAHSAGYFQSRAKADQARKDPDLKPVRSRDAFKKLLRDAP